MLNYLRLDCISLKMDKSNWATQYMNQEVNQELREHLVEKLVSAIFPTTDSNERNSNDDRIKKLYNFARKVSIERLKQEL